MCSLLCRLPFSAAPTEPRVLLSILNVYHTPCALPHPAGVHAEDVQAFFAAGTPSAVAYDSVAEYSSFGPTTDGRIKPDIVAPGGTARGLISTLPVLVRITVLWITELAVHVVPVTTGRVLSVG